MQFQPPPPGFRFNPTDKELVIHYLQKKVRGEQLPSDAVIEGEAYDEDIQLPESGELYILNKRKKYKKGKRATRSARNGYWKVTGNKKDIVDESGMRIGTKRSLVFKNKSNSRKRKNRLIDEYSLDISMYTKNSEEWVLCRVKESNRSPENLGRSQEEGDDHDNNPIEQFHAETSAGPSHLVPDPPYDQSGMAMNTPAAPALLGSDDIWDDIINEKYFSECLYLNDEDQP